MVETYEEMVERHKREIEEKGKECKQEKISHLEHYGMHLLVAPNDIYPIIDKINTIIDCINQKEEQIQMEKIRLANPYAPDEKAEETEETKRNPFSLYYLEPQSKGVPERIKSLKATREFKTLWKKFIGDWKNLQEKFDVLGASDTAARDAQVDWIKRHAVEVH